MWNHGPPVLHFHCTALGPRQVLFPAKVVSQARPRLWARLTWRKTFRARHASKTVGQYRNKLRWLVQPSACKHASHTWNSRADGHFVLWCVQDRMRSHLYRWCHAFLQAVRRSHVCGWVLRALGRRRRRKVYFASRNARRSQGNQVLQRVPSG